MSTSSLSSEVSIDQFLTLFTTQLQNQNPLEPADNTEFLSQLAQFSTLEQSQKQTDYLDSLTSIDSANLQLDQISLASEFIGQTITYSDDEGEGSYSGIVEGVKLEDDGTVSFIINGESVSISNLLEVSNTNGTEETTEENT